MKNKGQKDLLVSVEEICSGTWEPLYRFVYYKVQNREEAEDITQETYVKAIPSLQHKRIHPDKRLGFLKTVAMNVLRDRWRKKKRNGLMIDLENISPLHLAKDDSAEESAQKIIIEDALEQLNKEQRTIIELRILKGYSVFETAKMMNKKESTVRVMQHRALKTLAKLLKKED